MAVIQLSPRLSMIVTGWHRFIMIAFDPYRPELHYMRGPGPKWRAKYQGHRQSGAL